MADTPPPNPVTAMAEMIAHLREMYESLIAGGFTDAQATRIIGIFLAESARPT